MLGLWLRHKNEGPSGNFAIGLLPKTFKLAREEMLALFGSTHPVVLNLACVAVCCFESLSTGDNKDGEAAFWGHCSGEKKRRIWWLGSLCLPIGRVTQAWLSPTFVCFSMTCSWLPSTSGEWTISTNLAWENNPNYRQRDFVITCKTRRQSRNSI